MRKRSSTVASGLLSGRIVRQSAQCPNCGYVAGRDIGCTVCSECGLSLEVATRHARRRRYRRLALLSVVLCSLATVVALGTRGTRLIPDLLLMRHAPIDPAALRGSAMGREMLRRLEADALSPESRRAYVTRAVQWLVEYDYLVEWRKDVKDPAFFWIRFRTTARHIAFIGYRVELFDVASGHVIDNLTVRLYADGPPPPRSHWGFRPVWVGDKDVPTGAVVGVRCIEYGAEGERPIFERTLQLAK